jgi:predicted nucleic acid-binding protein
VITAVDTNVLLDVFRADPEWGASSAAALRTALAQGGVVACEVVWVETAAVFGDDDAFMRQMADIGISYDAMSRQSSLQAAGYWRRYRAGGGPRSRMAADFLIGAHASTQAERLLTRDAAFYRTWFEGLLVMAP